MVQKKENMPKFCDICGKEIEKWQEWEGVQTKRKYVIYVHKKCFTKIEKKEK